MTREDGINLENHADPNMEVIQKGQELQLKVDFTIDTERKILGCAHFPTIDKERELILSDAISKALPDFMKHPILHYRHTERPVGTVTKAYIDDDGAFHIEGSLYDTPDNDDVWEQVTKGELNKYSIYGKRLSATPECSIPPGQRVSPCVTKALTLFSISLVGDNAINPNTYLEVAKGGDTTEPEDEKEDGEKEVEKSDGMMPVGQELVRADTNMSSVLERLGKVEEALNKLVESDKQVHDSMGKSEDKMENEDKKEEAVEKCNTPPDVKKAEAETQPPAEEYITKAVLATFVTKAELDTFQKAFDDLKSRVEKMENETIEKGGNVVVVVNDKKAVNPNIENLDAIGTVL